jgi:hypothetical protein
MHAPAERVPLAAFAVAWPSAWLMHEAAVSPAGVLTAAAVTAGGVLCRQGLHARARRKASAAGRDLPPARLAPGEAGAALAVCAAWLTAADAYGPGGWLGAAYALGSAAGYTWLRCHGAVQEARARRDADAELLKRKTWWHQIAPLLGLGGFDLQEVAPTLLGEDLLLTSPPGSGLASRIAANSGGIRENLEHLLGLEYDRTDITTTRWPGQLRVSIRYEDPSVQGDILHPALDPESRFAGWFPAQATIREPVPVLVEPETGEVRTLPLWTERGGVVIGVYAAKGSGKTTLLDGLRERITVMPDAVLVDVNGAKVGDELAWEPLAAGTVAGSVKFDVPAGTASRALAVLEWLQLLITERTQTLPVTGDSVFQPTASDPAVVALFDEIDELMTLPDGTRLFEFIASKGRQASVTIIVATQRAINKWTGGGGVKANLDWVLVGNMNRPSETRHATGAEYDIPDISAYSKGEPGFFQIWAPQAKAILARGRGFNIGTIGQQQRLIIWHRDPALRPALPGPALDLDGTGEPEETTEETTTAEDVRGAQPGSRRARLAAVAASLSGHRTQPPGTPPPAGDGAPPPAPVRMIPGVPAHAAAVIMPMLERGTTAAEVGAALGVGRTKTLEYLGAFRDAGVAASAGRGPATGWHLTGPRQDQKRPPNRQYGTIEALAEAVAAGSVEVDDDAREMLARVRELRQPALVAASQDGGDSQ